jgi:predicted AAA+ superfamily ATPase
LIAQKQGEVYYWSPQNTRMEIDFMIQAGKNVVPIEVKAAENLHAKSLRVFCEKYKPAFAVRTSLSDYRKEDWMMNVPLYAAGTIYYMDTP